jgi:hypothetical protein
VRVGYAAPVKLFGALVIVALAVLGASVARAQSCSPTTPPALPPPVTPPALPPAATPPALSGACFTAICVGSPGTVCADGTVVAGYEVDGTRFYATRCDAGQTWNGSACTGTRLTKTWNNGSTNYTTTGIASSTDGRANTAALAALSDAGAPYQAAAYCDSLTDSGHDDWYLPAYYEFIPRFLNKTAIGGFDVSGNWYWTSSEDNSSTASIERQNNGSLTSNTKNIAYYVRCVRR